MHHIHPSLNGCPKRSLNLLCDIDAAVRKRLEKRKTPWQTYIIIDLDNSDYDAIYVHTPNPNKDNYPTKCAIGKITRNPNDYKKIIDKLTGRGYYAFKIHGYKAICAQYDQV